MLQNTLWYFVAVFIHGPGIDEPLAMFRDENNNGDKEYID